MNRMEESFSKTKSNRVETNLENNFSRSKSNKPFSFNSEETNNNFFSWDLKSILIIILIIFVLFPALFAVILSILGESSEFVNKNIKPRIIEFLKLFGYSAGTIINTSADVATDVSRTGIDIAGGSIKDVGNLMQGKTGPEINKLGYLEQRNNGEKSEKKSDTDIRNLDEMIQKKVDAELDKKITNLNEKKSANKYKDFKPDTDDNSIQKPMTSEKTNWCLVGEYQNKRGCVAVAESDVCLSGQIFPSKEMCLNPTLTP
jgi:hypothetical protein